jgi:hypothetical protein
MVSRRGAVFERSAAFLVAVTLIGLVPERAGAQLQDGCFEVVAAQGNLAGTILLNRCSGETWLLVKTNATENGSPVYRWRPVAVEETESAPAPAQAQAPPVPKTTRGKCFTFDGRQFCE